MAQRPAVVFIARHGPRLDAADQSWHLSTPTPYDPPLTYAGWNQSRALGVRIAALLDARDTPSEGGDVQHTTAPPADVQGVATRDFAPGDRSAKRKVSGGGHDKSGGRRKRRKYKVVMHTSPFLRCVQTSVAIAAGMAQYQRPDGEGGAETKSAPASRPRTPASLHSASPRLRGSEGGLLPSLAAIPEPLEQEVARRSLEQKPQRRMAKLRVDPFLGEWLNPQYFEQITAPPPSAMMVATAKAALISDEPVDYYTPNNPQLSSKSSASSLWGGAKHQRNSSTDSVEDMSALGDALPPSTVPTSPRRDRTSSFSSLGNSDSSSGRPSGFRSHHLAQPLPTIVGPETSIYQPPVPQYAVSGSDPIPRGYVGHARQACVNVDYQWDSSRAPQSWGDGGEYGEEWSSMHKRFRRGLNHLVQWYSQHNADDRAEDALGLDQAEHHDHDDDEELVMILVTHGAGCNALIGALTAQPVLLDIGMASLTMAVRKEDAPPMTNSQAQLEMTYGHSRRSSIDMGLSAVYDMKMVSSSDHLRVGVDPAKAPAPTPAALRRPSHVRDTLPRLPRGSTSSADSISEGEWDHYNQTGRGSNSSLGSILRPSLGSVASTGCIPTRTDALSTSDTLAPPTPPFTPRLWTPLASRTSVSQGKPAEEQHNNDLPFGKLTEPDPQHDDLVHDPSASPPDSENEKDNRSVPSSAPLNDKPSNHTNSFHSLSAQHHKLQPAVSSGVKDGAAETDSPSPQQSGRKGSVEMPKPESEIVPSSLSRGLSQKGLWGSKPRGARVPRTFNPAEPKRRWTVIQGE